LTFSLHGKCSTGTVKKLLDDSAIPASAFHHAINAVIIPKTPAACCVEVLFMNSAMANSMKVMSKKKNNEKNASVDLSVHRTRINVNINHPIR